MTSVAERIRRGKMWATCFFLPLLLDGGYRKRRFYRLRASVRQAERIFVESHAAKLFPPSPKLRGGGGGNRGWYGGQLQHRRRAWQNRHWSSKYQKNLDQKNYCAPSLDLSHTTGLTTLYLEIGRVKKERGRGKPKCCTSWPSSRGVTFFPFSLLRSQFFLSFPGWKEGWVVRKISYSASKWRTWASTFAARWNEWDWRN